MRRGLVIVWLMVFGVTIGASNRVQASSDERLIQLLIRKGIITQEEYEALKAEVEQAPGAAPAPSPPAAPGPPPAPSAKELVDGLRDEVRAELRRKDAEALTFALLLEGEARYRAYGDVSNRRSGPSSELYLRTAQLDVEAKPLDWITAHLTVKSEYVGAQTDNQGEPADSTPFIDTGIVTLKSDEEFPLYGVVGIRTQPFGGFLGDGRFASEPMSKNAYEARVTGATVGYATPFLNLDASLTAYGLEAQMDQLFVSGLFDSTAVVRQPTAGLAKTPDSISSFIAALTLEPVKDLKLGAAFLSEPGAGSRNQTVGVWASYTAHTPIGAVIGDAEFYAALSRERYVREVTVDDVTTPVLLGRAFKERVLTLGLTYQPLETLDLGIRYEYYGDDGLADTADVWTAAGRVIFGTGYTLYKKDDIAVRLVGEYRYTDLRRGGLAQATAAPNQQEVWGKISVSYK